MIDLDGSIPCETLEKILELLRGPASFSIKECEEAKVSLGYGIDDSSDYYNLFGEVDKTLAHEGPFFRGPDGETRGYFQYYFVKAKTNLAIVIQEIKRDGKPYQGTIYFLRKPQDKLKTKEALSAKSQA